MDIARERFPFMAIAEDCNDNIFGPADLGRFGVQNTFYGRKGVFRIGLMLSVSRAERPQWVDCRLLGND